MTDSPAGNPIETRTRSDRARVAGRTGVWLALVIAGVLAGIGWLYALRGPRPFGLGPDVGDALPLLQLADADAQPLLRVLVAWLPTGIVLGLGLRTMSRPRRFALVAGPALLLLAFFAQQSYAIARNLALGDVLWSRRPGVGVVIEALVLGLGAAVPAPRGGEVELAELDLGGR